MEFFLDTASITEIKSYKELGLVDGVTTNPALLSKEGNDPVEQIREIAKIVTKGPISAEVTHAEPDKMVKQAIKLAAIAENIIIKVPASVPGLQLAQKLKAEGIRMNITLIFHATQAAPFIKMEAEYISIFVGRVEDFGLDNRQLIWDTRKAIDQMGSSSKLLAASMRNPDYLNEAIIAGCDAITVPPECWKKVYYNPLFIIGEKEFMDQWRTLPDSAREAYEDLS